jgi:high-affinity iron transporter
MAAWFNVAALLIMFREALEAAIIIAVLLQLIARLKMPELKKWVWLGALSGLAVSIVLGVIFILVFYLADTKLLDAKASAIFKGCICWVAALLITIVSFSMLKFYNLERKWRNKLHDGMSRNAQAKSQRWSMFLLAGSATLREGIESVLFLTGVSAGSSVKAVIFPGLLGILIGSLLGLVVYYTGHSIRSLKWFFIASAGLLLIIAGGMVVNGTAFFQNAGLFGAMWPYELRPWANKIMWDTSGCCDPNTNEGWALMRALFGYQAIAMNIQLLYYCMYWALTLALLWYKWYHGTLTDAKAAQLADQESFNRHALEDLSEGSDVDGKISSEKASSADLEAGLVHESKEGLDRTSPGDSAASMEGGGTTENPAAAAAVEVVDLKDSAR